jgi:RNA polymerase sigma-70 factor (ECF subfamily)
MNELAADEQDRSDMEQLARGHDAALNDLIERHGRHIFHYVLRHLSSEEEASDVTQEVFVKLYKNRLKFRPDGKFSTWLFTIATNLVRDHLRWHQRHPETSLEARDEEHRSFADVLAENSGSPSEQLIATERAQQVQRAVQALPEELKTSLILSEYENLAHAEIGKILGCSPKAVEMRIYRARQILREKLSELVEARP